MAGHGDCLWIEYGNPDAPTRVLVDGGAAGTFVRLQPMLDDVRDDNGPSHALLVVTHVDADHIAGTLPILASPKYASQFAEIWFNGRKHLEVADGLETMGARQGESVTDSVVARGISWNGAFAKKSVVLSADGTLPTTTLPGGATVTLLSPGWPQLNEMAKAWDKEIAKAGIKEGIKAEKPVQHAGLETMGGAGPNVEQLAAIEFAEDTAPANGSSIAMLLEFEGKRLLLGADAHPSVLLNSIRRIMNGETLDVEVFKIPHHGSKFNVTTELLELVRAKTYVFSSNGAYFEHPDQEAVAKVIKNSPAGTNLVFNCKTSFNKMWGADRLQADWEYQAIFGAGESGIEIRLLP